MKYTLSCRFFHAMWSLHQSCTIVLTTLLKYNRLTMQFGRNIYHPIVWGTPATIYFYSDVSPSIWMICELVKSLLFTSAPLGHASVSAYTVIPYATWSRRLYLCPERQQHFLSSPDEMHSVSRRSWWVVEQPGIKPNCSSGTRLLARTWHVSLFNRILS